MRGLALTLIVALALTGCAGDPATPTATPTPTLPPTPSPTAVPSPTPDATPSPASPTPAPIPPRVVADQTFDFNTEGDPTGQSPRTRPTSHVPPEYETLVVNVTLERASAAPTQLPVSGSVNAPTVRVLAPDGTEVLVVDEEGAQESLSVPAIEGAWSVRYEGAGTMRARVLITAHAA